MRKIYVVGNDAGYANWMEGKIVPNMKEADLVVFTGGEDVSPILYGERAHSRTMNNPVRDRREQEAFHLAKSLNKKMVGICRGAQFLCVMAGGKLVQDQEMQPHYHLMHTHDGQVVTVSSTHHQAQYPWNLDQKSFMVLGFTLGISSWHENGKGDELVLGQDRIVNGKQFVAGLEVEVCHYPKIKALGIQPHPEYFFNNGNLSDSTEYFQRLLTSHMEDRL